MEMVSAARLRRAEQRIAELRPYARGIRMMTRRAVEAAENIPGMPLLEDRENVRRVGIVAVTGDRGLAGAFNSQIVRAANRRRQELRGRGQGGRSSTRSAAAASRRCASAASTSRASTRASPTARSSRTRATSRRRSIAGLRGREARPRRDHLQPLRVAARPDRRVERPASDPADRGRD